MGLQSDCICVLALEKLVGLMVQVHILPIKQSYFCQAFVEILSVFTDIQ